MEVEVVCGTLVGTFDRVRLRVRTADGRMLAPSAFEREGGKGACKKWKETALSV